MIHPPPCRQARQGVFGPSSGGLMSGICLFLRGPQPFTRASRILFFEPFFGSYFLMTFWSQMIPQRGQVGPHVGSFLQSCCLNFRTCLRTRCFIDFWWFLGGLRTSIFWFSPRQKHNFHIFVKVFVGIVFDSQNPPKIRPNRPQEGSKVDQKSDRKICWVWERFLNDFWSFLGQSRKS